jgi:phosphoribosylformylglycinamidine synthase
MKNFLAEVKVVLREGILDAQGKATENSLHSLGFNQLANVRIGKIIMLSVEAENAEIAKEIVAKATNKLLANTIIEDYKIEIL